MPVEASSSEAGAAAPAPGPPRNTSDHKRPRPNNTPKRAPKPDGESLTLKPWARVTRVGFAFCATAVSHRQEFVLLLCLTATALRENLAGISTTRVTKSVIFVLR
jgi:hypothetical protein